VGSIFAFAVKFPQVYSYFLFAGMALAGVTVSFFRIVTKYIGNTTIDEGFIIGTHVFFFMATVYQLLCVYLYYLVQQLPLTIYSVELFNHASKKSLLQELELEKQKQQLEQGVAQSLTAKIAENIIDDTVPFLYSSASSVANNYDENSNINRVDSPQPSDLDNDNNGDGNISRSTSNSSSIVRTLKRLLCYCFKSNKHDMNYYNEMRSWVKVSRNVFHIGLGLMITYFITFTLMPGVIADIKPQQFLDDTIVEWTTIGLLTTFAVSDSLGKISPVCTVEKCVVHLMLLFFKLNTTTLFCLLNRHGSAL